MSRYETCFAHLSKKNEGMFIPFVTLGDPDPETSLRIIDTLVSAGTDALELGIPFSDPLADGPTIQNANLRAFAAKITVATCFSMLQQIRTRYPELPIGLLVYANLVFSQGITAFYQQCANAGVDSVLVADVPIHESHPYRRAAKNANIAPIFICPPNASTALIAQIAEHGRGYTYLVSRAGVTGAEHRAVDSLHTVIEQLEYHRAPAAIQGFGISTPTQVNTILKSGAKGVIAGSATVNIIENTLANPEMMLHTLHQFVVKMKRATVLD